MRLFIEYPGQVQSIGISWIWSSPHVGTYKCPLGQSLYIKNSRTSSSQTRFGGPFLEHMFLKNPLDMGLSENLADYRHYSWLLSLIHM